MAAATIETKATSQHVIKRPPAWLMKSMNGAMTVILRSPLHGMVSSKLMLITFTGRKSGKQFTTPVTLERNGDTIYFFSRAPWVANLKGGAPVTLHIANKKSQPMPRPFTRNRTC